MKTAVLLSGQIRDAKDCFTNLKKHVIDQYNADVFIDTWVPESNTLDHRGNLIENNLTIDEVLTLYKPKLIVLEDFDNSPFFDTLKKIEITNKTACDGSNAQETNPQNIFYMYYKVLRCFQSMNRYENVNNFKYDTIIRTRFDLMFEIFPTIQPLPQTVYIPFGSDHRGGINDLLSLGDRETMAKVCDLYQKLMEYYKMGIGFHPESIFKKHLEFSELNINRFEIIYKLRGKYI